MTQSELWMRLADQLGVMVFAPFELKIGDETATFPALLPQFGSRAGMIVDSDWESIEPHADALSELGFGYSAVTLDELITDDTDREMLRDWGWSASEASPDWL